MLKLFHVFIFLFVLFIPHHSSADTFPKFFEYLSEEAFFPDGMDKWQMQKNMDNNSTHLLRWTNAQNHEIKLLYSDATPTTVYSIYENFGEKVDQTINRFGGRIIVLNDFFCLLLLNGQQRTHAIHILYATPAGVYLWKYTVPNSFHINYDKYISSTTYAVREHQYKIISRYGNVIMGRWAGPVHNYAKLLAARNIVKARDVYEELLQASPSRFDAQIEYSAIAKDKDRTLQCAAIVEKNAEEKKLLDAAATILQKQIPEISSCPALDKQVRGLKVVLIPLEPCNPWLLDEIARKYEKITSIPVIIRKLPLKLPHFEASRSSYRPNLEVIGSRIWKDKSDFSSWSLAKLKKEILNKAREVGPLAVAAINQLFLEMDNAGYQWDAKPIVHWLSQAIAPYCSNDPRTMVVGITEMDIYAGDANFIFSMFGGQKIFLSVCFLTQK